MDRRDRANVASFFRDAACAAGDAIDLTDDALQHALARRLNVGEAIRLINGRGAVASGSVVEATRRQVRVAIASTEHVAPPTPLELLVPVADRDRMLIAAEKCVELQVTSWRPVLWARSQSVVGRGAGDRFAERVVSRMRSALEQSGGAWLPTLQAELPAGEALRAVAETSLRVLLDAEGAPLPTLLRGGGVALAVGPEGGVNSTERHDALSAGWALASIGSSTLRFETAIIAGAAVARALQSTRSA